MKHVRWLSLLSAAALTVCCLASCGQAPAENETETGEPTAVLSSVSAETVPTEPSETPEKTTQNKTEQTGKTKKETTSAEQDVEKVFPYGIWNDGSRFEYDFQSDGTGTLTDASADKTESFRFEVNEKKGTVTLYMGEKEKKKKADYQHPDETHLTLTFSKKETVALTFGALIRKGNLPFRMGTWKGTNDELYIFRPDGSGLLTDAAQSDSGTPFRYEVDPESTLLLMHFDAVEEVYPAVYTLSDDGLYMTIAYEFSYAELTWQNKSTE